MPIYTAIMMFEADSTQAAMEIANQMEEAIALHAAHALREIEGRALISLEEIDDESGEIICGIYPEDRSNENHD